MGDSEEIAELEARRSREHRLGAPPMRDVRQLAAFVRDRTIVLWTGKAAVPNMADAIAGRVLRGSWMANPEVHLIYRLTSRLSSFVAAPLILGKSTAVDPSIALMLYSLAADTGRRAQARSQLSADARRLLNLAEDRGVVRMDQVGTPTKEARKARVELEREFLVHSYDVHTASGAHMSVVGPWATSPLAKMYEGSEVVALEEAQDAVVGAAIRSAVIAPVREVRRWFTGSDQALDRLVQREVVRELRAERDAFVTTGSRHR